MKKVVKNLRETAREGFKKIDNYSLERFKEAGQ